MPRPIEDFALPEDNSTPEAAEARRLAAVRGFQAAQGRYPDMMAAHRAEKLAEMEADERLKELSRLRANAGRSAETFESPD